MGRTSSRAVGRLPCKQRIGELIRTEREAFLALAAVTKYEVPRV
jgi:hypothetical protein